MGEIQLRPQPRLPIPVAVDEDTRVFLLGDDPTPLTLSEILVATLKGSDRYPETVGDHRFKINLGRTGTPTRFVARQRTYRITRMVVHFRITVREEMVPLQLQGYRQEFVDGHVAWMTSGHVTISGHEVEVLMTVSPTPDGLMWQGRIPRLKSIVDFRVDGVELSSRGS